VAGKTTGNTTGIDLSFLKRIGLSDGPVAVYKAMLDEGDASVQRLHEITGFERRNVYDMITRLAERGLVTHFIDGKVKRYRLANPERALGALDEKIAELQAVKEEAVQAIPEIKKAMAIGKIDVYAEIYRGRNAIKTIFEDLLECKDKHNYIIGGNKGVARFLPPSFWPLFNRKRVRKRVWWHDLIQEGAAFEEYEKMTREQRAREYYEYRFLPPQFQSPNAIFIYGARVANVVWSSEPTAFVINDEAIAANYLDYFKLLWEQAAEPL